MRKLIGNFSGVLMLFILMGLASSCSKEEGEGGTSSLFGRVLVRDYNATFTVLQEEYYAPERDVYLIYGDDKTYSERVRTNYNGTYEFKYLRPGNYHIFVYSKDSTLQTNAPVPVIRDVNIPGNHKEIEVPLMIVFE
ncbi:MAG: hypothetical protein AB9842_14340 [Bacteroidales bacterium]